MSTLNAMHLPAGSLWMKARLHEVNGEGQPDLDPYALRQPHFPVINE